MNKTYITKHAIGRWRERSHNKKSKDITIIWILTDMLSRAVIIEPDPEYRIKSLMRHGFRETFYYEVDNWIMVIVNDNLTTMFIKPTNKSWWNGVN